MSHPNATDLAWLLNDLIARVPQTQHAVMLSNDGLLMAASAEFARENAEQLAAMASSLQSLAIGVGRHFHGGATRQTTIELDQMILLVTAAGHGASLAVLATAECDIGVIAYEMAMLIGRLGKHLTAAARSVPAPTPGR